MNTLVSDKQLEEKLKEIKPGKDYPSSVYIEEDTDKGLMKVQFYLQSYLVGMYAAIYVNGSTSPAQSGDHNNKTFVTRLKKDLTAAIKRGAKVEIGPILPVKTEP